MNDLSDVGRVFENLIDCFLSSTKLIFLALFEHYKNPVLTKTLRRSQIFEKTGAFRHSFENFDQYIAFFLARAGLQN